MGNYSSLLLGDQPEAQVEPVQSAPRRYSDDLLGGGQAPVRQQVQKMPAAPAVNPNAEPDSPTWVGRRMQDIRGRRDARFKDVPEFAATEGMEDLRGTVFGAQIANADDAAYGDIIAKGLGDRLMKREKDAHGYEVITYRSKDGKPIQAYVNKPGLGSEDVIRGVTGALPFVATGGAVGAAMKTAPLVVHAVGQGITAGATSLGGDAAAQALGSDQGADVTKAGIAAAGGAGATLAAPLVGALWRRFVTQPGIIDMKTGQLTERGLEAARKAGLDPSDFDPDFARKFASELARTGDPKAAASGPIQNQFGIQKTTGEATENPAMLLKEQRILGGAYGQNPSNQMQFFNDRQRKAIEANLMSADAPTAATGQTVPNMIAGRSIPVGSKGELGESIRGATVTARDAAKAVETEAWEKVGKIKATEEALSLLPERINRGLAGTPIIEELSPASTIMLRKLEQFMSGEAPGKVASFLSTNPARDVDQMRRVLLTTMSDAATNTDKRAASAIYRGFNDWIEAAADKMVTTDPLAAANLAIARGISREVKSVFTATPRTAGEKIMAQVLEKTDSAEGVVNALFTGPTSQIKNGTVEALQSLKTAYDRYLPPEAAQRAWNDVRLAYWARIVQNKDGNPVGVQQFLTNLGTARNTQSSVFKMLFSREEQVAMRRLEYAVKGIEKKNLNRSWTGPSVGGFLRESFDALLTAIGWNSPQAQVARRAIAPTVYSGYGSVVANRATSGQIPTRAIPLLGPYGAAGASAARSDE